MSAQLKVVYYSPQSNSCSRWFLLWPRTKSHRRRVFSSPFKSSLLLFSFSWGIFLCRLDAGSRVSKMEHVDLWICSQITTCMDAGAVSVAMPWAQPVMEKSGGALTGGDVAGDQGYAQRQVPCQGYGGQQRGGRWSRHPWLCTRSTLVAAAHLQGHSRHWPEGWRAYCAKCTYSILWSQRHQVGPRPRPQGFLAFFTQRCQHQPWDKAEQSQPPC